MPEYIGHNMRLPVNYFFISDMFSNAGVDEVKYINRYDSVYTSRKAAKIVSTESFCKGLFRKTYPLPNSYRYYIPPNEITDRTPGMGFTLYKVIRASSNEYNLNSEWVNVYGWLYHLRKGNKLYQRQFSLKLAQTCDMENQ